MSPIIAFLNTPMSKSISMFWNLGSMLGMILTSQIVTGLLLAICFTADGSLAFLSVQYIMFEVNFGWLVRLIHFNGASLFFIFLFLHLFKGMVMFSFRLSPVWWSGLTILILVMGAAFFGYVIVWAQMSYWACNVITNMISVVPYIGSSLILWVWGGFSVNTATLGLLFVLHFIFPFLVFGVMMAHIILLHNTGSTSRLFTHGDYDKIQFHPYFTIKDSLNLNYWAMFILFLLLFPWYLGDVEMFIEANTTASPVHIVPEWYFLYVYAILRSIPNKVLGVLALVLSFVVFYILPLFNHYNNLFDVSHYLLFWVFISNCCILTWIGGQSVEMPFTLLGLIFTVEFFIITTLIGLNFKLSSTLFN